MKRKLLFWIAAFAILYGNGYCVARWRKFIVMYEDYRVVENIVVRRTGPGIDLRDNRIGQLKNRLSPYVFTFFRPLGSIEDSLRGSVRPLRSRPWVPDAPE